MKYQKRMLFFGLSLVLHVLVIWVLAFGIQDQRAEPLVDFPEFLGEATLVELLDETDSPKSKDPSTKQTATTRSNKVAVGGLSPSSQQEPWPESIDRPARSKSVNLSPSFSVEGMARAQTSAESSGGADATVHGTGPLTAQEDLEISTFMAQLANRIDSSMIYPEEFVDRNIQGTATIKVRLSPSGQRMGSLVGLETSNHYLGIFAAAVVNSVLQKPLPTNYWLEKPIEVSITVRFQTQQARGDANTKKLKVAGNRIDILHERYHPDPLTLAYQDLRKYLVVIPIANGFMIDFVSLYYLVSEWNEPSREWKTQQKLDLLTLKLDRMLEKQGLEQKTSGPPAE